MTPAPLLCIVEDDVAYGHLVQEALKQYLPTHSVVLFENGAEFLANLRHVVRPPELIILDCHMPILDGFQTLLRLKDDTFFGPTTVIMMSTEASVIEIKYSYEEGAACFLIKEQDIESLKLTMASICEYFLPTADALSLRK